MRYLLLALLVLIAAPLSAQEFTAEYDKIKDVTFHKVRLPAGEAREMIVMIGQVGENSPWRKTQTHAGAIGFMATFPNEPRQDIMAGGYFLLLLDGERVHHRWGMRARPETYFDGRGNQTSGVLIEVPMDLVEQLVWANEVEAQSGDFSFRLGPDQVQAMRELWTRAGLSQPVVAPASTP